jgi:S-formylglutathione hydrolase
MMSVTTKATIASFGGKLLKLTHNASTTNCEMGFNLFLPPQTLKNPSHKVPLLIYLAGLTCTGDNGAEKGFFQHAASEKGIAVLYPDTSPRTLSNLEQANGLDPLIRNPGGLKIQGEDDDYDFGSGAGFYVDATKSPWAKGYKMYSYITSELPKTVFDNFKEVDGERVSIFGHSMGGHGALSLVSEADGGMETGGADAENVSS